MFDELRCKYPLPVSGANRLIYQTKDTEAQCLDLYEIRKNGTLWHQVIGINGKINFYTSLDPDGWLEFSAHFKNGITKQIDLVEPQAKRVLPR